MLGSLINFGIIRPTNEVIDDNDGETEITFDDVELSEFAQRLADSYGCAIASVSASGKIANSDTFTRDELREWGQYGGLCEVRDLSAADLPTLRDLFVGEQRENDKRPFRQHTL